ncbi:hypothetical protein P9112_008786 [Eukaryota sp. TZLM1-RC]
MSDTFSVSRVFTRSFALNSLLTPAAVQQIRADLPLVTEIGHKAFFLLQSFLLNFSLASRASVEQVVWYLFMTVITTGFFPKPSTSKNQRQLLHIIENWCGCSLDLKISQYLLTFLLICIAGRN